MQCIMGDLETMSTHIQGLKQFVEGFGGGQALPMQFHLDTST